MLYRRTTIYVRRGNHGGSEFWTEEIQQIIITFLEKLGK